MSCSISVAAKPCIFIGEGKGKLFPKRSTLIMNRAGVIAAPKSPQTLDFPTLSKQGIPLADLHVEEIVERQSQGNHFSDEESCKKFHPWFLEEAYESCRKICAEYAKTFYLGTLLMTKERQRAIWAIYGKRTKSFTPLMAFLKRTHFRKAMKVRSFGHFQIKICGKVLTFFGFFYWCSLVQENR